MSTPFCRSVDWKIGVLVLVAVLTSGIPCTGIPCTHGQETEPQKASDRVREIAQESGTGTDTDDNASIFQRAVESLANGKFRVRQDAFETLIRGGSAAIKTLEESAKTQTLESSSRCVEAIAEIAKKKVSADAAIESLRRLAEDETIKTSSLAARLVKELTITDEERAIEAIESSGGRIHRDPRGAAYNVMIGADRALFWLRKLPTVRYIYLNGPAVTDSGMKYIAKSENITNVSLINTSVSDFGLLQLRDMPALNSLSVMGPNFTAAGIADLGQLRGLEYLSLTMIEGLKLDFVSDLPRLKTLSLSHFQWDERSLEIVNQSKLGSISYSLRDPDDHQIHLICKLKPKQRISISNTEKLTLDGWTSLGKCKASRLSMMRCTITDAEMVHIAKMNELTSLSLYDAEITDKGIEHLQSLRNLRYLRLRATDVTDEALERLKKKLPTLSRVTNDKRAARIAIAPPQPREPIRLIKSSATGKQSAHIRGKLTQEIVDTLIKTDKLSSVYLSRSDVDDAELALLAKVPMERLYVSSDQITDQCIEPFESHDHLRFITIRAPRLGDAALNSLAKISKLEQLSLSNAQITDDGVRNMIHQFAPKDQIQSLMFSNCNNLSANAFDGIGDLSSLTNLFVSDCDSVTGDVCRHVKPLRSLQHLSLSGSNITAENLKQLDSLSLYSLHLTKANVTPELAEVLVGQFPKLKQLSLKDSQIIPPALDSIAKLQEVEWLMLVGTGMGDQGLQTIGRIPSLKFLYADQGAISDSAHDQFRDSHPSCQLKLQRSAL